MESFSSLTAALFDKERIQTAKPVLQLCSYRQVRDKNNSYFKNIKKAAPEETALVKYIIDY